MQTLATRDAWYLCVGDRAVLVRDGTAFRMHKVVLGMGDSVASLLGTVRAAGYVCARRLEAYKSCSEVPAGVRGNGILVELHLQISRGHGGVGWVPCRQLHL